MEDWSDFSGVIQWSINDVNTFKHSVVVVIYSLDLCKPYLPKARSQMQCSQNGFSFNSADSLEKSDDYQGKRFMSLLAGNLLKEHLIFSLFWLSNCVRKVILELSTTHTDRLCLSHCNRVQESF